MSLVGRDERTHHQYLAQLRRYLDLGCILIEGEEKVETGGEGCIVVDIVCQHLPCCRICSSDNNAIIFAVDMVVE